MKQAATCYGSDCSYLVGGQCQTAQCCNDTPDVAKGVIGLGAETVAT